MVFGNATVPVGTVDLDSLNGNNGANQLSGGDGNDVLNGFGGNDGFEEFLGVLVAPDAQQQFGPDAGGVQPVEFPGFKALQADGRRALEFPGLDGFEDRAQMHLAVSRLTQPLMERAGRVGLEQIAAPRIADGAGGADMQLHAVVITLNAA